METERILLRYWQESDAEALFKYASDPDVGPHAGWPAHESVEELSLIHISLRRSRSCHRLFHRKSGSCMYYHRHSLGKTAFQDGWAFARTIRQGCGVGILKP